MLQTLLNYKMMYAATLVPIYAIVAVNGYLAFRVVGGNWRTIKSAIFCKQRELVVEE